MPSVPASAPVPANPSGLPHPLPAQVHTQQVLAALRSGQEVALIDLREEDPFAQAHPLFAAQLSLARLELDVLGRIPRRDTPIVVYDNGEGLVATALQRLRAIGYSQVAELAGGLAGWREAGGELFRDVNVPSKAFGELVESERHTPSLSAQEVKDLIERGENLVVLDARRFEEYQTMSIPGGISVPGGELALRVRALAPDPATRVVVNCAGRTRSIIGTQSLRNAGIPNPVAALRNGTIGWLLAGQTLNHGASRRFDPATPLTPAQQLAAGGGARALANRAGVQRTDLAGLRRLQADAARTTYLLDVRTPEECEAGHLPGARSAPGGQLVQETDVVAPVRGARIVLVDGGADTDGVRANMAASWLAQMGWTVWVLDGAGPADFSERGPWRAPVAELTHPVQAVDTAQLQAWLAEDTAAGTGRTLLLDLTTSANHVARHIPGAQWVLRSELAQALPRFPSAQRVVLTCGSSALARYAVADVLAASPLPVFVLDGGNAAWVAAGLPVDSGDSRLLSPRIDRYRRPYEGTDAPREAMQAYLDWEFGLVEQLGRDASHGFKVV